MKTTLLTDSKVSSHAAIHAELTALLANSIKAVKAVADSSGKVKTYCQLYLSLKAAKKKHLPLEDLLMATVAGLCATQSEKDARYAELIYARHAATCVTWRTVGGNVDDNKTLAGVSDYTRESSAGIPSLATPHSRSFYHRPRPQYLAPATQEAICGPTAKQANWRKQLRETARKGGLAKRSHVDNAAKQRAYRERIKAKLLASK